ncbi:ABC transporter ATP-binding protein [Clostridium sp. 19966]|uniref:ABC transporter ATP-binding protein n=1 Tax=Clostridium sp. 19966 TaxID=2768166 RepID=UPI0028DE7C58|nr:ABC transporter ATP-binding protein [Clostridium sp. 19966]
MWKYLKPHKWMLILGLVLVTISSALNMVVPWLSGIIVDQVIVKGQTGKLIPYIIVMIVVTLVRSAIRYGFQIDFESISQRTIFKVRSEMYNKLQFLDVDYFDKNRTGDIMTKLTGDMDTLRHFIAWVIYMIYENSLIFIFGLGIMFYINYKFAFAVFLFTIPVAYFARKLTVEVKPTFKKIRAQFSRLNTVAEENISGNRVVKAFAKEDFEMEKFEKANAKFKQRNLESAAVWSKYLPTLEFLSGMLNIVTILVGGILVIKNMMSVGQLVTFNSLIFSVNNPLRMSGWLINDCQRFTTSAEKILELLLVNPDIKNAPNALDVEKLTGDIEFKDVNFSYDGEKILENINLKVKAGETIGIVGATGSGKTSIINLLCRFYDCSSGGIYIGGTNIKNINLQCLRRNIGAAMQDIFLFSDTIEGNIAYGVPETSIETVKDSAEKAQAADFIKDLEDAYDTIIGERGVGLSGGQKQRISLARALIKDPSILILDDTTSAVDMETEHEIQTMLNKYKNNRTTFIIAHRISSVKKANKIIVMDNGRIVEEGTHDELVANKGYYYEVFKNQYGSEVI